MNVIEAINSRHSVRAFTSKPVEKETILKILEAAVRSPSWADSQPWEVYVAGGEPLERMRRESMSRFDQGVEARPDLPRPQSWPTREQKHMAENMTHRVAVSGSGRDDEEARRARSRRNYEFFDAPVVVYLCLDRTLSPYSIFDMGAFAQSIMLAGQEYGVDSIPAVNLVAYPDLIRAEMGIPDHLMILLGIALGYADQNQRVNQIRSLRAPVDEVVHFKGV